MNATGSCDRGRPVPEDVAAAAVVREEGADPVARFALPPLPPAALAGVPVDAPLDVLPVVPVAAGFVVDAGVFESAAGTFDDVAAGFVVEGAEAFVAPLAGFAVDAPVFEVDAADVAFDVASGFVVAVAAFVVAPLAGFVADVPEAGFFAFAFFTLSARTLSALTFAAVDCAGNGALMSVLNAAAIAAIFKALNLPCIRRPGGGRASTR